MTALDFETAGYDLTGHDLHHGHYFDRKCFCSAFTIDSKEEACSHPTQMIDVTMERLWIHATCGSTSLPDHWTDGLRTTEFKYIPTQDWDWPKCVADIPYQVKSLSGQCTTLACEIDSSGYCNVKRAVDRACFCRDFSYDSCGGSCHIFETRMDYVQWLHDLCGNVPDWHGLPDNWRRLAAATPLDLIPWRWTLQPSNDGNVTRPGYPETCASNEWKLGSFTLVNIATLLAPLLG